MIKNIQNIFVNLDNKIKRIMKNGLKFCTIFIFISILILITYNLFITTPLLYKIGTTLFKINLTFFVEFIICGIAVDKAIAEL